MQSKTLPATSARRVKLLEPLSGIQGSLASMTVGCIYDVLGSMGSCLIVSTDVRGKDASVWRGRFQAI